MPTKPVFFAAFLIAICSCHHPVEKDTPANGTVAVKDSAAPAPPPVVNLTSYRLDGTTLIQKRVLHKGKLLADDAKRSLHIAQLDQMPAPEFKYRLVDTLYAGPQCSILLIGREYDNENKVWLAIYDPSGNMTSQLDVYYDNAEGFLSITSVIKDKNITVTTLNDFEEKEQDKKKVKIYTIDDNGKLQMIN